MKKFTKHLTLSVLAIFCATYIFAQTPKSCDLEVTLVSPAPNSVINYGEQIHYIINFKNNGPTSIVPTDYMFISVSDDSEWTGYSLGLAILPGGTATWDFSSPNTNTTGTDRVVDFCIKLLPQANGIVDGNPVPVTYIDPNPTNDTSCNHTITLKTRPTGIFDAKTAKETLSLFPNPATSKVGFSIALDKAETVSAIVRDLTGREVMTKNFGQIRSGTAAALELNVANLNSGIYVVEVVAGDKKFIGKVTTKD